MQTAGQIAIKVDVVLVDAEGVSVEHDEEFFGDGDNFFAELFLFFVADGEKGLELGEHGFLDRLRGRIGNCVRRCQNYCLIFFQVQCSITFHFNIYY